MTTTNRFNELPLLHSLQRTLAEQNLTDPTEIQAKTIPLLLAGKSIVGVSETGSGKTLAFALPVMHVIKKLENDGKPVTVEAQPRALIIVPARELGEQVTRVFKPFTHDTRLRVRSLLGGTTMPIARRNITGMFEVLVATPGRLLQMQENRLISLADVRILVFDEVDKLLDQGFLPDAETIIRSCPENRQMALFSATVSKAVQALVKNLFANAEVVRSEGSHKVVPTLTTLNRNIPNGKRFPALEALLKTSIPGGTLIFANTREQCDELADGITKLGRACVIYRGEMDKVERRANLRAFRDGKVDLLIATDLASRGLDVAHVGRVINYHLPHQLENYIHRVGRTARAGRTGMVVNFVTERDRPLVRKLETIRATAEHAPRQTAH